MLNLIKTIPFIRFIRKLMITRARRTGALNAHASWLNDQIWYLERQKEQVLRQSLEYTQYGYQQKEQAYERRIKNLEDQIVHLKDLAQAREMVILKLLAEAVAKEQGEDDATR